MKYVNSMVKIAGVIVHDLKKFQMYVDGELMENP